MARIALILNMLLVCVCFSIAEDVKDANAGRNASAKIKKNLEDLKYKYEVTDIGNFKLIFDIVDSEGKKTGRSHQVFIAAKTEKWEGWEVIRIWATVEKLDGLPDQKKATDLLLQNYYEKFGKWELVKRDDGYRILYVIKVSLRDPLQVFDQAIQNVFGRSDAMEKMFTGKDEF